ncbi:glycoside hydrolase family 127 protein [Chitinophaga sp. sic0106]|uniref:glycoside hydrolase family 127 protein n=1 Tax=Chitinophaga sp. sic0106 TaxID=2854785 RepID=UPI001C454696|nr:glycoside hydrolase family 127 protein [Chitinophaga sp. sic0106]MBV7529761.1 glycoside hydrolase family 127 protein [Chitinophaga sp. sic0106]
MKKLLIIAATLCSSVTYAQSPKAAAFPLSAVHITNGPFLDARRTDEQYILSLDADRLLAPFLREAGLPVKKESYGNWEKDGLDGHIGGHYLSALALMYASTGDQVFQQKLQHMLDQLELCQQANKNGYIGGVPNGIAMWEEVAKGNVGAVKQRWVPWYNVHKTYSGLLDAYRVTGSVQALRLLTGMCKWAMDLTAHLSDAQMQEMLQVEHGGMNEIFAAMAQVTGNQQYMQLARRFSHNAIYEPLHQHTDKLTGLHANTQIPKVIGFMEIGMVAGDTAMSNAAAFFWHTVVDKRSVAFGGNSVREHFNPVNNFTTMLESREGPETCNSYNMLKLTKMLFLQQPQSSYMDYYERTLYNHILSSQHPNGGFVYFTPIRPMHYRVHSKSQECFWCCVGTGLENHAKYGEMIYAHDAGNLYVNLFIASGVSWKEKGVKLTQQTNFPFEASTQFVVTVAKRQAFTLKIRKPSWLREQPVVQINNRPVAVTTGEDGYLTINRTWANNDKVTMALPMHTRLEPLPDGSRWAALVHGPIVLAASDTAYLNTTSDDSRWGHIANGKLQPLENAPMLMTENINVELQPGKNPMEFTASHLIWQNEYKQLLLKPFFQVQDARYVMYWPYGNQADINKLQQTLAVKSAAKEAIEAATLDVVHLGEQQPESDHQLQTDGTAPGLYEWQHYRHGKGWFSIVLNNKNQQAKTLLVKYLSDEKENVFTIAINGRNLKEVMTEKDETPTLHQVQLTLPENTSQVKVQITAARKGNMGKIGEVRLLGDITQTAIR